MKILFLTTSYPRFGKNQREFAMNIHNLAKEISRKGNEVTVVAPNDNNTLGYKKVNNVVIDRFSYWFPKQSQRVSYGDGIPDNLKNYANILSEVSFIGQGHYFQIWEPRAAIERQNKSRERLANEKKTLANIITKSGKKNEPDIKMHDIQKTITLEDLTNPDKK